jgi:hypothetical protein
MPGHVEHVEGVARAVVQDSASFRVNSRVQQCPPIWTSHGCHETLPSLGEARYVDHADD